MSPGIYEIVCLPTGKKYIGSSVRVYARLQGHRRRLMRGVHINRHLQAAWHKYGDVAFEFRCVEHVEGLDQLLVREQWHLDRCDRSTLFNFRLVADSNRGFTMPPVSAEVRAARAEVSRIRIRSPEERAKISATLTGRKNGPHSEETRRKISAGLKGKRFSAERNQKLKTRAIGRKLPERTTEIDAKIKEALRAAWVRRKARQQSRLEA